LSKIRRIRYFAGDQAPIASASANPTSGPSPLTVNFSSAGSSDPEGQPLTYSWSKFPPPGSTNPGATNCGTFTENNPEPDQAWWSHPNEAQNGNPGCSHTAQEHPGHISVVVTDPLGAQAEYTDVHGSANFSWP
jgi:hypothetical protein